MILITYLEVTFKNKNNNVIIPDRKDDDGTITLQFKKIYKRILSRSQYIKALWYHLF